MEAAKNTIEYRHSCCGTEPKDLTCTNSFLGAYMNSQSLFGSRRKREGMNWMAPLASGTHASPVPPLPRPKH